jgi:electron transfer flavoprotein alpha subunit
MSQDIYVVIEHLRGTVSDISYVMLAAARVLAQAAGGNVVALLLGHDARDLAADLGADAVWYIDHPSLADFTSDAYQKVLADVVSGKPPRAVLLGDTSIGGDLGGWLAARLTLPLISHCRDVVAEGDALKFTSQICGGKILASGDIPGPTALVMMVPGGFKADAGRSTQPPEMVAVAPPAIDDLRVSVKEYVEPAVGDVDVSRETILISVGRGMQSQDNIDLAKDLAKALGGEVSASRPVVDQGWMPITRLVGKSGKRVKPALYLALGISGAPEHVEAITDAENIIAINTDPAAPIFDIAKYGAQVDVLDLLPVLTEKVTEAKGG